MAVWDMKLDDLKVYKGSKIKACDFDEYWNLQIEYMDSLIDRLEFEIIKKEISSDNACYYDLVFKSFDGSNIYAKYITPNTKKKAPLVLEFHDYKTKSNGWFKLSRYIGIGYSVLAMDCRGQGGLSSNYVSAKQGGGFGNIVEGLSDRVDDLYFRKVYLDAYILSKIGQMLNHTNLEKIIVSGKGQGASLAMFVAAYNKKIKKCVLDSIFLADFKRVLDLDLDVDSYLELRTYIRNFDAEGIYESDILNKLSYIDVVNFASKIECDVLVGTGLLDKVSVPSTQFAVFNNIGSIKKKHVLYSKYGHEHNNFFENEYLRFISEI